MKPHNVDDFGQNVCSSPSKLDIIRAILADMPNVSIEAHAYLSSRLEVIPNQLDCFDTTGVSSEQQVVVGQAQISIDLSKVVIEIVHTKGGLLRGGALEPAGPLGRIGERQFVVNRADQVEQTEATVAAIAECSSIEIHDGIGGTIADDGLNWLHESLQVSCRIDH